ncbi:hypothetical protein PF008_g15793 [Phytophthora fragariae]|uniref:RxLR effector PexRD54 WY domain-containing protein n=1 Tax=Phytophthora fragariae TaxID=53985 RepID=A0A6G0RD32_9STRA|nr:hypothetical protein PF008_g15793 [Phytophthora fragariae]
MSLEVMVAGAIAVASHYNGLAGLTFSDFFSALLFELGMQNSEDISVKFPKDLFSKAKASPQNLELKDPTKVFNELRLGKAGLKLDDNPAVLEWLRYVGPEVEKSAH